MSIVLYKHNQKAYEASLDLMAKTGKAAIVHPTGTGKSFIGFKLAEEHPKLRICWLSPSEHIYETQMKNLKKVVPDCSLQNMQFYTYAKLMMMETTAIADLCPDYIVFDEFHRCGAAQWGQGVQRLLQAFPQAKILGLSATNIRYLDNQRDMAQELFGGNVASEMTLGEAIARNILLPPTYVISVYSYQKELEKYQHQVKRLKQQRVREAAEKYLEALRRALSNADGLDTIFQKHMPNQKGKYIVFCANYQHMREMIDQVSKWFSKMDKSPRVYAVYSAQSASSQDFENFQGDESNHIKLLFCINMLNEGVHMDDVDGVILFRPTVSPIIYKQQIGRALSANQGKNPVIFDIVNNFENLYSINSIQEEVKAAVNFYRHQDQGLIVNGSFHIIDEVRDCRRLFETLQETLSSSWNMFYAAAKEFYESHGHLEVPKRYKTANQLSLGAWITTQRRVKQGKVSGILTENQITQLDALGMIWRNPLELRWEKNFSEAQQYYQKVGNLRVPVNYVTEKGFPLGRWICNLRQLRAQGKMTIQQIELLSSIGMIWGELDYLWEKNYQAALDYYLAHGHLQVSCNHVTPDGFALGRWIARLRLIRKGRISGAAKLTKEQIRRLDAIGMVWGNQHDNKWEQMYAEAKRYALAHGSLDVPNSYVTEGGVQLGKWIYRQRIAREQATISEKRMAKLNALGMVWIRDSWEERYLWAKQYYEEFGHLQIPQDYKTKTGLWLGKWLYEQRMIYKGKYKGKALSQEQIARLEAIGMNWLSPAEQAWEKNYAVALEYFSQHGNLDATITYCTEDGVYLGRWLLKQRSNRKKNKAITEEQIKRLNAIGMNWGLPKMQEQCLSRTASKQEEAGFFL